MTGRSASRSRSSHSRSSNRATASPDEARWSTRDLVPIVGVALLAVVVLAGLGVLPAKTWFSQRANLQSAEAELQRLAAENAELERQAVRLTTDEEIELRARRDFGLVFPGEESYRIVTVDP